MRHLLVGIVLVAGLNQTNVAMADPPTSKELIATLNKTLKMKDFKQPLNLRDTLGLISEHCASKGWKIAFIVDGDAYPPPKGELGGGVLETGVSFVYDPDQMKVEALLKRALTQLPDDATFLVRGGFIEITTKESARVQSLLQRTVSGVFDQVKLRDALTKLSDKTGASIILDPRVKEQAKTPITATLRNDVTLEGALYMITDMADLQFVVLPSGIYVTTEQRAKKLKKRMPDCKVNNPQLPLGGL